MRPCPFFSLSLPATDFSPPSVSVSLKDDQLLVMVQFPCAVSRRCSLEGCCPITELIDPWTTVTVYNELNHSKFQVRKSFLCVTYKRPSILVPVVCSYFLDLCFYFEKAIVILFLQSRTVWSQEAVTYVDFSDLAPGQTYCAVANFSFPTFSMAASSKSAPQCFETVAVSGGRKPEDGRHQKSFQTF